jgi:hypothetical protein
VFPTFKDYLKAVKPYLDMVLDANVNPTSTDYETSDIKAPGMGEFQGLHEEGIEDFIGKGFGQFGGNSQIKLGKSEEKMKEGLPGMKTLFVMDYQSGKMFSKMVPANMQSEEIEDMLADEYGMNPSDVYYMITDDAEVENLDDANLMENEYPKEDDLEMPSRIEGLVDQRELAKFAEAVMAIAQDLDDEGFDAVDIKKLLKDKLDDMIIG